MVALGSEFTRLRMGDAVGAGCMVDSCRHCRRWACGLQPYCEAVQTDNDVDRGDGTATQGGYSESIVVDEAFVLRVPENLDPAGVAALLCADIELVPNSAINEAYERMLRSDMKHRFVIDMETLKA